ncbi:hypothetical protein FRB94_013510 [Tulasnella sp. JGI-2019a]|nr:hypothetical protein FRB94_013510 [Tulasnella sp. JGI-2019a]
MLSAYDQLKKLLYDTARDRIPCSELFLDLSPDKTEIRYYWADHSMCQIFWVEDVPCPALGLPNLTSEKEIKSRLIPEYWTHAEYFPMHMPVKQETEDAIVAILRHGCVDNMTSPGSTFPFSEVECQQYIQMLEGFRSLSAAATQGYRNAVIGAKSSTSIYLACIGVNVFLLPARIWNAVARARHINRYGLESPRLDRLQGLASFSEEQIIDCMPLKIGELMCFLQSADVFDRLTSMWNGRVVYQRHWHAFFKDMRADWLRVASMSAVLWLGGTALLASGAQSVPLLGSIAFSGASSFTSLALCHKHRDDILATGPDISKYIMSVESYYHGLRPLSIIYIIPHTLAIYSAILFSGAVLMSAWQSARSALELVSSVGSFSIAALPIFGTLAYFDPDISSTLSRLCRAIQPPVFLTSWFQGRQAERNVE